MNLAAVIFSHRDYQVIDLKSYVNQLAIKWAPFHMNMIIWSYIFTIFFGRAYFSLKKKNLISELFLSFNKMSDGDAETIRVEEYYSITWGKISCFWLFLWLLEHLEKKYPNQFTYLEYSQKICLSKLCQIQFSFTKNFHL